MYPRPLVPRLVVITLSCCHQVTIGIPPEVDPDPGDEMYCYECNRAAAVVSVAPTGGQADDDLEHTPILHHGEGG